MIPITTIIPTRNEETNIDKCLQSIHTFVEQICVIDSESTDRTLEIVKYYGAEIHSLPYDHQRIIPWIIQWGLDNLPIRNEWVLILEADQVLSVSLRKELQDIFSKPSIPADGYYIRRKQIFRGRWIRFGGYGSKYLLKLFKRSVSELDINEEDTRVYVKGRVSQLKYPLEEENIKENEILFYLQKHLRYADAFAKEEIMRQREGLNWKTKATPFGSMDQRSLWLKGMYYRMPHYLRPWIYFIVRYFILLGFLDGKEGATFHLLQALWFRLIVDIRIEELKKTQS